VCSYQASSDGLSGFRRLAYLYFIAYGYVTGFLNLSKETTPVFTFWKIHHHALSADRLQNSDTGVSYGTPTRSGLIHSQLHPNAVTNLSADKTMVAPIRISNCTLLSIAYNVYQSLLTLIWLSVGHMIQVVLVDTAF